MTARKMPQGIEEFVFVEPKGFQCGCSHVSEGRVEWGKHAWRGRVRLCGSRWDTERSFDFILNTNYWKFQGEDLSGRQAMGTEWKAV